MLLYSCKHVQSDTAAEYNYTTNAARPSLPIWSDIKFTEATFTIAIAAIPIAVVKNVCHSNLVLIFIQYVP